MENCKIIKSKWEKLIVKEKERTTKEGKNLSWKKVGEEKERETGNESL